VPPVERNGAILLHLPQRLEQEQLVELDIGVRIAHRVRRHRPALERGGVLEPTVRCVVILALEPAAEAAVQRREARRVFGRKAPDQLRADGAEEAFDFTLPLRTSRLGVDQRDAELGADEREVVGAVVRSVVDV